MSTSTREQYRMRSIDNVKQAIEQVMYHTTTIVNCLTDINSTLQTYCDQEVIDKFSIKHDSTHIEINICYGENYFPVTYIIPDHLLGTTSTQPTDVSGYKSRDVISMIRKGVLRLIDEGGDHLLDEVDSYLKIFYQAGALEGYNVSRTYTKLTVVLGNNTWATKNNPKGNVVYMTFSIPSILSTTAVLTNEEFIQELNEWLDFESSFDYAAVNVEAESNVKESAENELISLNEAYERAKKAVEDM